MHHTPPAQASAELNISASPARVWQLLTDINAWPTWYPAVDRTQLEGPLAPGSRFRWRSQGFAVTSTLTEVRALSVLAWHGRAFGTRAQHEWQIWPSSGGVTVRTSETFDGWLPRLFSRSMQKKLETTLPAWLLALKVEAERQ